MSQPSLDEIGVAYDTDKSNFKHDYLRFYETQFAPWRHEPITFVELGINKGGSIRTWETWFTQATVIGVDIKQEWVNQKFTRARTVLGDCGDRDFLASFAQAEKPFIMLDDASHFWSHQIAAFEECFPHIQPGGFFVVEDLNCSFGALRRPPFSDQWIDAFTYFSRLNSYVTGRGWDHPLRRVMPETPRQRKLGRWVDWMCFYRSTLVIRKRESEYVFKATPAKDDGDTD